MREIACVMWLDVLGRSYLMALGVDGVCFSRLEAYEARLQAIVQVCYRVTKLVGSRVRKLDIIPSSEIK